MRRQVSRLSFVLGGRLPAEINRQWLALKRENPLCQHHGYWDSPEFSSVFPRRSCQSAARSAANAAGQTHTIHLNAMLHHSPHFVKSTAV
jgi:hypothetical protein